jgi:hypothetical protein
MLGDSGVLCVLPHATLRFAIICFPALNGLDLLYLNYGQYITTTLGERKTPQKKKHASRNKSSLFSLSLWF